VTACGAVRRCSVRVAFSPCPLLAVLHDRGTLTSRLPAFKEQGIADPAPQAMSRVDY